MSEDLTIIEKRAIPTGWRSFRVEHKEIKFATLKEKELYLEVQKLKVKANDHPHT